MLSKVILFLILAGVLFWWVSRRSGRITTTRSAPANVPQLSQQEAREVLGLGPAPTREQIIEAHRRLMQKVHPDLGGSTYLARQLNEAKKVLLAQLGGKG